MNLSLHWPWSHRDPVPDPKAEAAEERVDALEVRADAAEESLRTFLRFSSGPVDRASAEDHPREP